MLLSVIECLTLIVNVSLNGMFWLFVSFSLCKLVLMIVNEC